MWRAADEVGQFIGVVDGVCGGLTARNRLELMSAEARAATVYWDGVARVLPCEFGFRNRVTRGAQDLFNMALNYGYGILYAQVWSAVSLAGLDPYAGFLHVDRPGRPSLVLDLIEEFRQQTVDRVLVRLSNRRQLGLEHGDGGDGGQGTGELSKHQRETIAAAVIDRLAEPVTYGGKKMPFKNVIARQARAVARVLREGGGTYTPFHIRW